MDWTLEVVLLPVSDLDAAIAFYRDKVGFDLDHDTRTDQMHVAQLTPRGSGCSIVVGDLPAHREMAPGSMRGLQLVVADAEAAGRSCSGAASRQRDHRLRRTRWRHLLRLQRPRRQHVVRPATQGPRPEAVDPGRVPGPLRRRRRALTSVEHRGEHALPAPSPPRGPGPPGQRMAGGRQAKQTLLPARGRGPGHPGPAARRTWRDRSLAAADHRGERPMTTLVDRYLSAVKEQLPRAQQDDVIAELDRDTSGPRSRTRRRPSVGLWPRTRRRRSSSGSATRWWSPLATEAIRRSVSFGRQLIGPELFPTYLKVLTVNVVITLVIARPSCSSGATVVVDVRRGSGADADPVRDRDGDLHGTRTGGFVLRPGRLGPANGLVDRLRRRRNDHRWSGGPADRADIREGRPGHDLRPRVRVCWRSSLTVWLSISHADEHRLHGAWSRLDRCVARDDDPVRHIDDQPARDARPPVVDALQGRRPSALVDLGLMVVLAWSLPTPVDALARAVTPPGRPGTG